MKSTLGVGISVLSALAAQGKDFDRAELNAMLDRLAASPEPKIEPQAIAMCYKMAMPKPEDFEYVCPKCGTKTVYPQNRRARRRFLRTLRDGVAALKAKGLNIELDESCLCQTCGKGIVEDEVRFGKLCWVINGRKVKAEPSDINLLSTFLDGKVILTGSRGAKSPLKNQLPRLKELLGGAEK